MDRTKRLVSLFILATTLSGCSYFQFPGVHKVEVQQGNILSQDMVDELRPGMSKSQVRYIMGTPLIADSFHQNRWDYYYSMKNADGDITREHLTIYFEDDELVSLSGDYMPAGAISPRASDEAE